MFPWRSQNDWSEMPLPRNKEVGKLRRLLNLEVSTGASRPKEAMIFGLTRWNLRSLLPA